MARWYRLVLVGCCLLAAGLRLYRLNDANPWWDEGFTYWLASQDLPGMLLRTAGDTHPPLSYLLYQLWLPLAGRAIYPLRFQAVLFGVLAVPVCGALGKRLGGPLAGIVAAGLLAISPFHIWWSQQIRMYALIALLCALSIYLFVKATGKRQEARGVLIALAAVNLAGLYTLYFFSVLILLQALFLAWVWMRGTRSVLLPLASCLVPSLLLLPWLAYFRQHAITFAADSGPRLSWPDFLAASWAELMVGMDTGVQAYMPLLVGLGAIALTLMTLLLFPKPQNSTFKMQNSPRTQQPVPGSRALAAWLLLVAAGLPLAAYGVTLLRGLFFSPAYQTRYDLLALPALVVLLGWGIGRLQNSEFRLPNPLPIRNSQFPVPDARFSLLALLPLAAFAGAAMWSLAGLYDARHRTDDYQSLARFVEAYERPGDVIVFDPDWNFHLFLLDYRGSLPWESIPLHQQVDAAWADQAFSTWGKRYQALWLLQESGGHDAGVDRPVRGWLDAHLQPSLQLTAGDRTLSLYVPNGVSQRGLNPRFEPQFVTSVVPGVSGFDQPLDDVRPGDLLNVSVYGQGITELAVAGRSFSGRALPGQVEFQIPVGAWMPPGRQPVELLSVDGRTRQLSSVGVESRAVPDSKALLPLEHQLNRTFGSLAQLTSYQVQPEQASPGQDLLVRLQWRALGIFTANYTVFVHVLDGGGHVVAQRDSQPLDGRMPTIAWRPGQMVDDDYRIALPRELAPGDYKLELGMYLQSTGQRLSLSDDVSEDHLILGQVMVVKTASQ